MASAASSSVRPRKNFISTSMLHSGLVSASSSSSRSTVMAKSILPLIGRKKIFQSFQRHELRDGPSARMIDQISSHGSSRYSEKMLPVLPIPILGRDHAEINLVHQLGGLQGVVLALALHQIVSQSAQVGEDQREELVFSLAASLSPLVQKVRDVSHGLVQDFSGCGEFYHKH